MSIESAEAFLREMKKDKALQEKIYLGHPGDKPVPGEPHFSEKKFFAIVTAAGFDFTREEWTRVAAKDSNLHLEEDPCPHEVASLLVYQERVRAGDTSPHPGSVCPLCAQAFEPKPGETVCPECASVGQDEDLPGKDPATPPASQKPPVVQGNAGMAECPRCGGVFQEEESLGCPFCKEDIENDVIQREMRRLHDSQPDPDSRGNEEDGLVLSLAVKLLFPAVPVVIIIIIILLVKACS